MRGHPHLDEGTSTVRWGNIHSPMRGHTQLGEGASSVRRGYIHNSIKVHLQSDDGTPTVRRGASTVRRGHIRSPTRTHPQTKAKNICRLFRRTSTVQSTVTKRSPTTFKLFFGNTQAKRSLIVSRSSLVDVIAWLHSGCLLCRRLRVWFPAEAAPIFTLHVSLGGTALWRVGGG